MNSIQEHLRIAVRGALAEANAASETFKHKALVGTRREIMVEKILKPVLTPNIHFGTGELVDRTGKHSQQLDVILYSPKILPLLFMISVWVFFPLSHAFTM